MLHYSALLFGPETCTLYQRHFVRLRRVQHRHLQAILRVSYTDRITNDQILDRAGVPDIEMNVRKMQLPWAGHVAHMSDNRIPKQLLFGELKTGVTVCACIRFACVIRSGYLVLANQHTSSEGQGSRDLRQTRVEPY